LYRQDILKEIKMKLKNLLENTNFEFINGQIRNTGAIINKITETNFSTNGNKFLSLVGFISCSSIN